MAKRTAPGARVFVVGSSNTDFVVQVAAIPRPGETVLGGKLAVFAGGKGANQAVAAARAGAKTCFVGAFGSDANGVGRRADLERDGIDCSPSVLRKGEASGIAMIALVPASKTKKGDNAIVVAPGANAALSARQVRQGLASLSASDVVLCSLEVPLPAVAAAAKLARSRGALAILNPAPLPASGLSDEFLAAFDLVTPNEHELAGLLGATAGSKSAEIKLAALCARLARRGQSPRFVITRGASGVDVFDGHYQSSVVTPPRVRAIDTVGAGDCFSGAFAAALALGASRSELCEALRFAVAASAISVTRPGAQASMPTRAEITRVLERLGH